MVIAGISGGAVSGGKVDARKRRQHHRAAATVSPNWVGSREIERCDQSLGVERDRMWGKLGLAEGRAKRIAQRRLWDAVR